MLNTRLKKSARSGFTLVELMVVIIIINLLSGVAIPKVTGLIEKSREKIDLLQLYHLRDALNRALYESSYDNVGTSTGTSGCKDVSKTKLDQYLADEKGMVMFVVEKNSIWPVNYQGSGVGANTNNMCGLFLADGFWSTALKEAGFGAVADIIADRANGDKINTNSSTYSAMKTSNGWWRTYPKKPIFISRYLNSDGSMTGTNQSRYCMKIQWTGRTQNSHSLEVFFAEDNKTWQQSLRSRIGTCFSTYGEAGCSKSK